MKEITDGAVFCGHCGARLIYPEEPLNVSGITGSGAFGGEKCEEDAPAGPRRISDNITVDQNGVYRWTYSLHLFKNPTIFLTIYKIFFFVFLGVFLFVLLLDVFDGSVDFESMTGNLKAFGLIWLVITFLVVVSYLIYALIMRGRYTVLFEMDDNGINHRQIPSQAKKAKAIGTAAMLTGLITRNPSSAAAGIAASRTEMYSSFAKTRKVKAYPSLHLIKVNGLLSHNQVYVHKDDFDFVRGYIVSHCTGLKKRVRQ